jgi:hypothetical protein
MFSLYDLAEIGACVAFFLSTIFVLVRKPGRPSARLYVAASLGTTIMWVAFLIIIPSTQPMPSWQQGVLNATFCIATAIWLMFLLIFARESARKLIRDRFLTVYGLMSLYVIAAIAGFFQPIFVLEGPQDARYFGLTTTGQYEIVLLILSYTFGIYQLESTFRASIGRLRRTLILPLLSLLLLLGLLLVSSMMGLLFHRIEFVAIQLGAVASIASAIFVSRFLVFEEEQGQRVVVSREAVYSSVAVFFVGAYFLLIGIAVWLLVSLGGSPEVFFSVLAAFVVIVIFVTLVLSRSVRQRWRGLVDKSIYSGQFDVLEELTSFAEDVTAATDKQEMFQIMVEMLEGKCRMEKVTILLRGDQPGKFDVAFPTNEVASLRLPSVEDWLLRATKLTTFVELKGSLQHPSDEEKTYVEREIGSYLIPLHSRKELVGFISCKNSGEITGEIRFLIDSISHQLALSLLSAKQSEALLETRELASFTKISSFVIHDVKNLISMTSMILQNAESKFDDPRFQKTTIDTLRGAQERMKRLIGRLSSPAKQIDFTLSDCNLAQIVLDLSTEMKLSQQTKVSVRIELADVPLVRGNEEKLKSVVSNLIINAIEAMPNGGVLILGAETSDDAVTLLVQDNGTGMTPEFIREKLFRPFRTTKPSGLGIGLFQSKDLVEQMGGELSASSVVNEGTCFKLNLKRV